MAEVGRILGGRYRLVELLGQGGMARIFRAQDAQLGRAVAVKVLRAEYGTDEAFIARFRQEAQSVAALDHPNIVNVFDYGTDEAGPFIVMALVTAGDLAQLLRERGALPPDAAARIARQVADALAAAHSRGIVHRDIKPSNVLLTDAGRVKVGDFGIAQAFAEAELTVPGMTMGSVHYFSPEQARGETTAPASDIYALGLMLYEMLTGNRAWVGDTAAAVAMARLTGEVPSPAAVRAGIPAELDDITRWALSPDPAARPSAERLAAALARLEAPAGAVTVAAAPTVVGVSYGGGRTPPPADADDRSVGRWGWLAAILGLLVLVAAGVLLFLFLGNGGRSQPSPSPSISLVTVPQLVGLTVPEAQSAAAAARLSMTVGSFEETRAAPDNTILAQDPAASAMTEQGATITVVVA
ncbi:MAG: protein kinase domain-containing protein, partial [Candidatus Limnocylindrales bacterium]